MTYADKCTVVTLIRSIIDCGYSFSVVDPEGCIFEDHPDVHNSFIGIRSFGHRDEECVLVRDEYGEVPAVFTLIYNNGNEFEPIVTISDYTSNEIAENIYRATDNLLHTGSCNGVQALSHI